MEELFPFFIGSVFLFPCISCGIQKNCRSNHIRLHKNLRILDTSVYVALCRKMYNSVNIVLLENLIYSFYITDVFFNKDIVFIVFKFFQIFRISCISKFIQINNFNILILFKHIMNIIASDKSGSTGY